MYATKKVLINNLINNGKAQHILDIMLGDDPDRISENPIFINQESKDSYVMTIEHLRFMIKFGNQKKPIKDSGKIFFPYPEYFEAWMDFGAPGITEEDLNYIKNKK